MRPLRFVRWLLALAYGVVALGAEEFCYRHTSDTVTITVAVCEHGPYDKQKGRTWKELAAWPAVVRRGSAYENRSRFLPISFEQYDKLRAERKQQKEPELPDLRLLINCGIWRDGVQVAHISRNEIAPSDFQMKDGDCIRLYPCLY